jgi:P27 family predicted phage terminase small subunit
LAKGRPPAPEAINNLKGCSNNRRKKQKDLKAPEGWPAMPAYFDEYAKQEWSFICEQLQTMKILSSSDRGAIESHCNSYSRYRIAQEFVAEQGAVIVQGKNNYMCINPWASEMNSMQQLMNKFYSEFGLTPVARARVRTDKDKDSDDDSGIGELL